MVFKLTSEVERVYAGHWSIRSASQPELYISITPQDMGTGNAKNFEVDIFISYLEAAVDKFGFSG